MLICFLGISLCFYLCGIIAPAHTFLFLLVVVSLLLIWERFAARRALVKGVIVATFSVLFSLSLGDFVLRYIPNSGLYYRPEEQLFQQSPIWQASYRFKPDRYVVQRSWGDLANLSCENQFREEREIEFVTDSFGFRNKSESLSGPVDILVVGDSFAYGSGTTQDRVFSNLLAGRLNRRTYNLAVPGAPSDQVRYLLEELPRLRLTHSATIVWMIFEGNDLEDELRSSPIDASLKRSFVQEGLVRLQNFQLASPIRRIASSLQLECQTKKLTISRALFGQDRVLFFRQYEDLVSRSTEQIEKSLGWQKMQRALAAMEDIASRHGFQVVLTLAPTKEQIYNSNTKLPSGLAALLRSEAIVRRFDFVDLAPQLRIEAARLLESQDGLLWWRDDTHWNLRGHQVVAEILAEKLS